MAQMRTVIILAEGLDETQQRLVTQAIARLGDGWWREFVGAWLVVSDMTPTKWLRELRVLVESGDKMLALNLPDGADVGWATLGLKRDEIEWLKDNFAEKPAISGVPDYDDEPPF